MNSCDFSSVILVLRPCLPVCWVLFILLLCLTNVDLLNDIMDLENHCKSLHTLHFTKFMHVYSKLQRKVKLLTVTRAQDAGGSVVKALVIDQKAGGSSPRAAKQGGVSWLTLCSDLYFLTS